MKSAEERIGQLSLEGKKARKKEVRKRGIKAVWLPDDAWDVIGLCGAACGVHKHLQEKKETVKGREKVRMKI
jgi:hypothetical protein